MKATALAGAIALLATSAAAELFPYAADQAPKAQAEPTEQSSSWTGAYVGGSLSLLEAEFESGGLTFTDENEGFALVAGFDYDLGNFVVGGMGVYETVETDGVEDTLTQLLARGGWAYNDSLVYAMAGYSSFSTDGDTDGVEIDGDGIAFGAGGEYRITDNFSVASDIVSTNVEVSDDFSSVDVTITSYRLRANYRF